MNADKLLDLAQKLVNDLADEVKKGTGMIEGVRLLYNKLAESLKEVEASEQPSKPDTTQAS